MESLDILEAPIYDNSIENFYFENYAPQSQDNLNTRTPIVIDIHATDSYIQPAKSYLVINGQLLRADNDNAYVANDNITLVNNSMMYLFDNIQYSIEGINMELIINPGQTTSMFAYLSQPDDYSASAGLKSCWCKDTTNNANSDEYVQSPASAAGA